MVAVRREFESLVWHAWVTLDELPLNESTGSLEGYLPVVIFGSDGALEWTERMPESVSHLRV